MDADQFDRFSRFTAEKLRKQKQRKEQQQQRRDNQRVQYQPLSENNSQRTAGLGNKIASFLGEIVVLLVLIGGVALAGSVLYNVAVPPNSRGCGSYNYESGVCMDRYEATQRAREAENFRIDMALDMIEERRQQRTWRDMDCSDFRSRSAAQAMLNSDRRDPHFLDADNDGIACER